MLLGDLFGLENVNNAYGWLSLLYGIGSLSGTFIAGV
jgi:hypothetical protein